MSFLCTGGESTQKLRPDGLVMSKETGRRYTLDRGGLHWPDPALVETEERGLICAHLALAWSEHLIFREPVHLFRLERAIVTDQGNLGAELYINIAVSGNRIITT